MQFEVSHAFGEASLEYVAIHPHYQNRGYGTALLTAVLEQLFEYESINDLTLCVSNTNDQASRVYEKVGFRPKDEPISYTLQRI
jgi:ribosomal protein S18 acetylase RimI-like enzyme